MFAVRVKPSQACKESTHIPFLLLLGLPANEICLIKAQESLWTTVAHIIWSFSLTIFAFCFYVLVWGSINRYLFFLLEKQLRRWTQTNVLHVVRA